ncbi:site-specific recombinase XerD [Paraburkholderia unamae]|uniref:tyrosine-type recombinase/integrase n=1 Tax=Paraburkholderia unamae TaxID=219649 RepID=UPI000DC3E919|nr:tyrosine-type recombinase/integrase [Paraburkholderia unamae]RAR67094.1 site-specific recombinase XerD [Paraburkholderia unamae]
MKPGPNKYRIVYIHPRKDFEGVKSAVKAISDCYEDIRRLDSDSSLPDEDFALIDFQPRLFELPLIAVIVDNSGRIVLLPTLFLADTALASRSVTGDTVRTYAEALLPWLKYVDDSAITLHDVTEETIGVYRAKVSHEKIAGSDSKYASATVNQRVVVPAIFHEWGQRRNTMPSSLGKYLCTADPNNRWHPLSRNSRHRFSRLQRIATPRVIKKLPVSLGEEEIRRLFAITPMPYKLMLKWSVACGFRRFEICDLRISDLPTPEQIESQSAGMMQLIMLRKGGKEVNVYVPSTLLEETNWFVLTERRVAQSGHENALFLNAHGRRMSRQTFTRAFKKSAKIIGSRATLHHLRHTFAVHVLKFLERRVNDGVQLNSLKVLQILLSHSNVVTTEIYLQAYEISGGDAIAALDFLYGATL